MKKYFIISSSNLVVIINAFIVYFVALWIVNALLNFASFL